MPYPGGASESKAPDLLANLRTNQTPSRQTSIHSQSFASLGPLSPSPTHSPAPLQQGRVMSPGASPALNETHENSNTPRTSAQMANPLLQLLKFGSASAQSSPSPAPATKPEHDSPSAHSVHGRGISASDLVSSFTGEKSAAPTPREKNQPASSANHQDVLLRLLNQTTARLDGAQHKNSGFADKGNRQAPDDCPDSSVGTKQVPIANVKTNTSSGHASPIRYFGSNDQSLPTAFEPVVSPKGDAAHNSGSIFTYVNPFEQLAASSPRNSKPKAPVNSDKRKIKSPSPPSMHASARRKLTPSSSELRQKGSPQPTKGIGDERSRIETLMGIGAPSKDAETVAEALNEVGEKVDRQVENALAKAEVENGSNGEGMQGKQEVLDDEEQQTLENIGSRAQNVAADVKKQLDKDESQSILEEAMPAGMAESVKDVIDEAANGKITDEWESAEGEFVKDDAAQVVEVYQFPMKPFVSITLVQKDSPNLPIREDAVLHVARFKKDFDQADRTLATATNDFIVYGMPKNGGIRVIEQENGQNSSIFSKSQDRIFNVAICTAQSGSSLKNTQTIIATGVSGTVYWTTVARPGEEVTQDNMEKQGLVIPPVSSQPDSTSGGQLKTRAKKSNRHPEFFAIGRGKFIQIIFTAHAQSSDLVTKEGLMDSDKYFAKRNLKVTTGKAGKDFTFSEDDSTIASLDKAGKLRIWDIRELTNEANDAVSLMTPIEVKSPTLTYSTAHSTEKSWPTSVLFVDKLRPYTKGTALRYIVVGMKQNHTLQLWDLCLGKAVQELSFPHESETDAICSVTYHPASGVIAVGHPTRNSIYFIHLSAPKYNLPAMSQAKFVQRLANKDSTLPKVEATAIMSGMREYSFAEKGQIRSIDLVPSSAEPFRAAEDENNPTLFELYVMHSKGVTCLAIKKEDLGWSKESKVLRPVDAEKNSIVVIRELRELLLSSNSEPSTTSVNGDSQLPATPSKTKPTTKENINSGRHSAEGAKAAPNVTGKVEKKKTKRNGGAGADTGSQGATTPPTSESYASAMQPESSIMEKASSDTTKDSDTTKQEKRASRDANETPGAAVNDRPVQSMANGDTISVGIAGDFLDKELKKIEQGVSDEFNKVLSRELEGLYRRFSDDKRIQDAAGSAKQDAMLRLVSSTLSENVEKSLSRIIQGQIQDSVVPSISKVTASSLEANLSTAIAHHMDEKMASILRQILPDVVGRTMQSEQVLQAISVQVTGSINSHVEREFSTALNKTIVPAFTKLAVDVAHKVNGDTERRAREQLQQLELQRHEDSLKIDQLANLVRGLSETLHTMAAAQSDFQVEILKQQKKAAEHIRSESRQHSPTPSESASMTASPEQQEYDAVAHALNQGRFEEATLMWLQSQQQIQLFDSLFVRYNPLYLRHTSPLIMLSVGAAVTSSLESNIMDRLIWLETVFHSIDISDPEIREVAGKILEVLNQRLEGQYMHIAESAPENPALRRIPGLARLARELKAHIT